MPIYEYECQQCGRRQEALQKMSDPPLSTCEACGGALKRLISKPAVQFKGSGWYVTDYARKGGGAASKGEGESKGEAAKGEGGAGASESKPAAGGGTSAASGAGSSSSAGSSSGSGSTSSSGSSSGGGT